LAYCILQIALDTPLNSVFDYRWACEPGSEPQVGQLALVNFGRREVVGLIVAVARDRCPGRQAEGCAGRAQPAGAAARRNGWRWRASPPTITSARWAKWRCRACRRTCAADHGGAGPRAEETGQATRPRRPPPAACRAEPAQQQAADAIGGAEGFTPLLLYGVTGSGKTEVYLQACAQVLARDPRRRS
jgi:primosomal protein N' (replication factor Y)